MNYIQEVIDFLTKSPAFYVGTVDEEGKPRVRPFDFVMEWKGKLTFITNNQKSVHKQLRANPYVEICAFNPSGEWVRISGKVMLFQDTEANKKAFDIAPMLKEIYVSDTNPILTFFCYEEGKAIFYSFENTGKPFKTMQI
ncbi:MAG: pyridoxamine 5'-phosphate oxidase family protein [Campylobacteraceae bacterium]|jgi:uncharacterized pyridoxamine 5'-phosphate oxidase family protein|nr:pyridoxamine 5'-phosphate oxidase family protein [Campylobacteraceae bacterium]